jgi:hypothetical protein
LPADTYLWVNAEYLELERVFGSGILERVPATPLWRPANAP